MTNVSYVALSRQAALAREIDSIANNIANANTSGFRRDAFIFSEFVSAVRDAPSISQTRIGGRMTDASQGDLISTGGDFDVALEGEGYFAVETPYGQRLTRNGAFMLNDQGVLVTAGGHPVSGEGGAAIVIPIDARDVSIGADGVVSAGADVFGRLEILDADPTEIVREGEDFFRANRDASPVVGGVIRQGFLEGSNVNAVMEISRMIEVQRAFEIGQQVINEEADRARRAVEVLSGAR